MSHINDETPALGAKAPLFKRILKNIVFVPIALTAPIWMLLVVPLIIAIGAYSVIDRGIREARIRSRMHREARAISRERLLSRIKSGEGTVIAESPIIGWGTTRLWWTPDEILALAPMEPTRQPFHTHWYLSFDEWCHDRYTDLDRGRALLCPVWRSSALRKALGKQFPRLKLVVVWSGALTFDWRAEMNDNSADQNAME